MQNKTHRLGRTCRNCTECRTDEHGLYCALDQSFLGWLNTRTPPRPRRPMLQLPEQATQ